MTIEKYKEVKFKIFKSQNKKFYYALYPKKIHLIDYISSTEYFDAEQEARFAAIGHIDLLENGEG